MNVKVAQSELHRRGRGVPDERDMHAHVTMHAGTIETNVQAKGDAGPCRVAGLAVETHLEIRLVIFTHDDAMRHAPCFPCRL